MESPTENHSPTLSDQEILEQLLINIEKDAGDQAMAAGMAILGKLVANIVSDPFNQKFRSLKTTNATIKSKILGLPHSQQLIAMLGYVPSADPQVLTIPDQNIGLLLNGSHSIELHRRLIEAKMISPAAYQKELTVLKEQKQQKRERQAREKESQRLKNQCQYDQQERKYMKPDETKSKTLAFGTKSTTFKDIGVDLCAKKGG